MGHIVNAQEFEKIRNNNCQISSVPSAPSTPPPRQQCQNLSTPQIGKARRLQTSVGVSSWGECVQSVSNLLPAPYAERWLSCLEQLLHNEGPLPESWRIYIAILALCRHEVTWAVRALTFEFISADGDRKWLSGLRFAPKKLRALTPINNLLAHRPWLLTSEHILDLTKGEESWSISELCQALCLITHFHSFASFLHACLPLPNTPPHSQSPPTPPPPPPPTPSAPPSLSSSSSQSNSLPLTPRASPAKAILPSSLPDKLKPIVLPLKLPSPVDSLEISEGEIIPVKVSSDSSTIDAHMKTPSDTDTDSATTTTSVTNSGGTVSMPVLVKKNKEQQLNGTTTTSLTNGDSVSMPVLVKKHKELNGTTTKNLTNGSTVLVTKSKEQLNGIKGNGNGNTVGGSKREIQTSPQPNKQSKNESNSTRSVSCKEETPSSLREFPHLCHDLSYAYEEFTWPWIFKILDFNWQDHGYCLMTRLLNEMGNLIDERLGAVKTISHPAWVKSEEGNAYLYRRAVWIYIQSLYGIFHESYSYPQIDSHLRQEVKDFIKTCCCRPETLEGKVPPQLLDTSDKHPSQLVPLSILIMEARTESGLLYALRAIIPHQC